jgi:hypothetical protein
VVNLLGDCAAAKRQHAAAEELGGALLVERQIVVDLADAPRFELPLRGVAVVLEHLVQQRMVFVGELGDRPLSRRLDVDDLEQQQCVVRGQRASRLTDDVRHR